MSATVQPSRVRARNVDLDEQIIAAAHRLLYGGAEGFTIQQLVEEAGVALQTFYRYFPSKDQLLLAVLERYIRESCEVIEAAARDYDNPVDRLHFYVTWPLGLLRAGNSAEAKVTTREHYRLHQIDPDAVAHATSAYTRLISDALQDTKASGVLHPADCARAAWLVTQLVMATFHYYAFAELGPDADAEIESLWRFCLAAVS
jgi:TetR/AcrR family transcriptional regulator